MKKYIVLLLQIAAVAAAGGDWRGTRCLPLVTALIGITFNFMVSMNFAPGFLIGFVYAICNGILAWQTKIYATFVFMNFYAGSDGSLQLLEMEREEETDGNHYAEDEPQGAELYGSWSDDTVWNYSGCPLKSKWNTGYQCFL